MRSKTKSRNIKRMPVLDVQANDGFAMLAGCHGFAQYAIELLDGLMEREGGLRVI
jgi:hypothetical protein